MSTRIKVAALLVTHNSQKFLPQTLDSIRNQTHAPDMLLAVDDFSTDDTVDLLRDTGFGTQTSMSTASDPSSRIAQNFQHGLRLAVRNGADVAILGDHDDVWHSNRVHHQYSILSEAPAAALLASNGFLIDEHGAAVAGTIRDSFPVPIDFDYWTEGRRWRYALRHSLATGGASAVRPSALREWNVPPGWLHDRWWSLVALRANALIVDPTPVIDYRLSLDQQVGIDDAGQSDPREWVRRRLGNVGLSAQRSYDLSRLLSSSFSQPR